MTSFMHKFCRVEIFYVYRQNNCSAHLLAKIVLGIIDFSIWIEEIPYFIQ